MNLTNYDFWPRVTHQQLIDAAVTVLPDASRSERAEYRILAIEALHKAVAKRSKCQSVVGRLLRIQEWLETKPTPTEIADKFGEASRGVQAH